jgi:hypothetical protein
MAPQATVMNKSVNIRLLPLMPPKPEKPEQDVGC